MNLGFLRIHQLSIKKGVFLIGGGVFSLDKPLMGDPSVLSNKHKEFVPSPFTPYEKMAIKQNDYTNKKEIRRIKWMD